MGWLHKYFIPGEHNNFAPHSLQKAAIAGMTVLILISFSIANLQSLLWVTSHWLVSTVLPAVVTDATNAARADEQLSPLTRSAILDRAAAMKAEDMANKGYFAHWSPDGVSPWYWFSEAGYRYVHAGENLAVHFTDSNAVVEAWLNSPSHRANILNANYTEIGIGTATGSYEGYDTVFVVQLFGAPAAAPVANTPAEIDQPIASEVTESGTPTVAGTEAPEENVSVTPEGTVVYESFAATSDPEAKPAAVEIPEPERSSFLGRLATSPRLFLQIAYSLIGLFVALALTLAAILEWRRHHPIQIAYSVALLLFMVTLFRIHLLISGGVIVA